MFDSPTKLFYVLLLLHAKNGIFMGVITWMHHSQTITTICIALLDEYAMI